MKKIFINALSAHQGGGQTYLLNLFENRPKGEFEIHLLVHRKNRYLFERFRADDFMLVENNLASGNIVQRVLFEKFFLPGLLQRLGIDVYYAPGGIMNVAVPQGCTSVVAFRNMLPFQSESIAKYPLLSYMRFRNTVLRHVFLQSFRNADKVIFISDYARAVIRRFIPDIDRKSTVIYHGLNEMFLYSPHKLISEEPFPYHDYYLYVSTLDVYKSQLELIESWNTLTRTHNFSKKLLLVGPQDSFYGPLVTDKIREYGLEDSVIYIGKVPYERLPLYYHHAEAILYASICENCPNILLESMASRKMIYCSNHQPMPEFGQESVVYFDPHDPDELVRLILSCDGDTELHQDYGRKAMEQARKFDWVKTAHETFAYLTESKIVL
ncbi:glycosyltransferase family 1 protein [Sulfuricurvum sp. IAE1]|uniref:glycosyltransferase family 4 protein n=1 Tax=Sulfuricurvum sp. IAE1 TaxID=2546102 RepID=UPI0014050C02|nr:glycosyltransferase family 1 protein [Sulfuricurvum sp. IAE1]